MSYTDVSSKSQQQNFGKLDKEYNRNGITVKLYSPDIPESDRTKADIQIREKIVNIASEMNYKAVSSL